jgi:hypothetical protein
MNHEFLPEGGIPARVVYDDGRETLEGATVEADAGRKSAAGVPMVRHSMMGVHGVWLDVTNPPSPAKKGIYFFFSSDLPPSEFLPEESLELIPDQLVDLPMETCGQVELLYSDVWVTLREYYYTKGAINVR